MPNTITSLLLLLLSFKVFSQNFPPINPKNIEIVRDRWGVPHIYGKTDAETAYGLAWANCEDAFKEVQEMYAISKPISGRNFGIEGAKVDFFRHFLQVDNIVENNLHTLPNYFLKYIDGYVQGLNAYAKKYPKKVNIKGLFPLTYKEVIKVYVIAMSSFTRVPDDLGKAYEGKLLKHDNGLGSNAIAVNKNKTADGKTYLLINPHMPVHGRFSFYEAHLNSEEGLNIHGTLFMGGSSIYMGNNNNLGWAMTWNHFDRGDIYKLQMHPEKKNTYLYDNKWKKLETKKTTLKVKVGFLTIPIKKESYWSELGPVIKEKKEDNYYAIKTPSIFNIKAGYQWYKMNKASNYKEFKKIIGMQAISMFNIVYADKEGNIYFISNGEIPVRTDSLVNLAYIPGHSSKYVWQRIHPIDELPQNLNPKSGFVFNTNNTPFQSTNTLDKIAMDTCPKYMDIYPGNNNRAVRVLELMTAKEKIDFNYFQKMKFDVSISKNGHLIKQLHPLLTADANDYPEIKDYLQIIQNWDFVVDSNDIAATLFMVAIYELFEAKGYNANQFSEGMKATPQEMVDAVRRAKKWLIKYYGTIKVPLGSIFLAKKGDKKVTPPGYPDVLAANYGVKKKNKFELYYGDAYTHFVKFNTSGVEELRTAVPFGNSNNPKDVSYFNQAKLYRNKQTKTMTLDKGLIYRNASEIYHPK